MLFVMAAIRLRWKQPQRGESGGRSVFRVPAKNTTSTEYSHLVRVVLFFAASAETRVLAAGNVTCPSLLRMLYTLPFVYGLDA